MRNVNWLCVVVITMLGPAYGCGGSADVAFSAHVDFAAGVNSSSVAMGDINGDGLPDFAIANLSTDTVSVFLNTTPAHATVPTFAAQVEFSTGSVPFFVSIGDLNDDGKPDLAVANYSSNFQMPSFSVLFNTTAAGATTPTFAAKVDFPTLTGSHPSNIAIGDINGDAKPDIAVANNAPMPDTGGGVYSVSVLLNMTAAGATTPSLATAVDFPANPLPGFVGIADLNGDNKPDLILTNELAGTVSVFLNNAETNATIPSFATKVDFPTGNNPASLAIGDLNGDGKLDLAVANGGSNTVSILFNTTAPGSTTVTFLATDDFATDSTNPDGGPDSIAIGDIDGDGKLDLAVTNINSCTVSVLLNTTTETMTPSFAARLDFPTGGRGPTCSSPNGVAIGDINGDGKPDLAVANQYMAGSVGLPGTLSVLLAQ